MTFTFGAGPNNGRGEGQPEGTGGLPFLPFMMMGGRGQGANPGQMGDYVFSQGALDKCVLSKCRCKRRMLTVYVQHHHGADESGKREIRTPTCPRGGHQQPAEGDNVKGAACK